MKKYIYCITTCLLLLIFYLFPLTSIDAQSDATVTESYSVEGSVSNFKNGDIVSTYTKNNLTFVKLSSIDNDPNLLGVVNNNAALSFGPQGDGSVIVVKGGIVNTYVTTLNGNISIGDTLTSSSIPGVAAKNLRSGIVMGSALKAFSSGDGTKETFTVNGHSISVSVGIIPVSVGITNFEQSKAEGFVNNVNYIGAAFTGKSVSFVREIFSVVIFLVGVAAFIVGVGLDSMESIRSIGRNPLASVKVKKSFFVSLGILFVVLMLTLVVSYFILTT